MQTALIFRIRHLLPALFLHFCSTKLNQYKLSLNTFERLKALHIVHCLSWQGFSPRPSDDEKGSCSTVSHIWSLCWGYSIKLSASFIKTCPLVNEIFCECTNKQIHWQIHGKTETKKKKNWTWLLCLKSEANLTELWPCILYNNQQGTPVLIKVWPYQSCVRKCHDISLICFSVNNFSPSLWFANE